MRDLIWTVFLALLALPALVISIMWLGLLLSPRKSAERMGWSVTKTVGMTTLWTVILLVIYGVGYAIAFG